VRFLQVGVPSRVHIAEYKGLGEQVRALVDQINWRWSAEDWTPIVLVDRHLGQTDMMALHRLARFCFVSSLHDGMNLVAKEFVSSRLDDDGVLILSRFAGSARELTDALLVNPYDLDECADALYAALQMPDEERRWRMQRMRAEVAENTVYRWAIDILSLLLKLDQTLPADASGAGA
jgi:trehalose 6-phosphate synthase